MAEEEDTELQRIRQKKMLEMISSRSDGSNPERQESKLNKPITITDGTFAQTVQKYPLVVVDCWAAWCLPCRMLAPIIGELAKEYAGRVLFGKLNVDENRQVAMDNNIMGIPTLLVFKNGELVDRIVGVKPKKALAAQISQYLQH